MGQKKGFTRNRIFGAIGVVLGLGALTTKATGGSAAAQPVAH